MLNWIRNSEFGFRIELNPFRWFLAPRIIKSFSRSPRFYFLGIWWLFLEIEVTFDRGDDLDSED